jgi:uncharacterized protein (DUF362 family)
LVTSSTGDNPATVKSIIERAGVGRDWHAGDAIFLKPNLTYPSFSPGVTTRVEFIAAVAEYFIDKGCRVTIGEGPGGYNGFSMREAFETHGLNAVGRRLNLSIVELSEWEPELMSVVSKRGATVPVPVPKPLLHDFRALVSLPVPKVHCLTGVSLGIKNLWGCIADGFRIKFHPFLDEIVAALAIKLRVEGAVLDGLYGLDKNGPMVDGIVRRLDWIAASSNCAAHDVAVCGLLGIDADGVSHLRYGMDTGVFPRPHDIDIQTSNIRPQRFTLRLNVWNRLARMTWIHPRLTWLVYLSPLAGPIHWLMYLIRRKPSDLSVRGLRGWKVPFKTGR